MSYGSTTDPKFFSTLETWIREKSEILVLIRYSHAGGIKDFEFFSSFQVLAEKIRELRACTCVIAFKQPQLPLRGVVDDGFINECLKSIPEGSEYLVVELVKRVAGKASWIHHSDGESHAELRDDLEESRGTSVAAGLYPPWLKDTEDVVSAVVPDQDGVVRSGIY